MSGEHKVEDKMKYPKRDGRKKGRKDRFAYRGRQAGALVGIQQLGGP